jgi:hypothetical protein
VPEDVPELEPLHAEVLAAVVDRLRGHAAVSALVPEQVFGPGADDLARAGEWARCVIVTPGRNYGTRDNPKLLVQRDVWVEMRAENQEVLNLLAKTVVKALNGATGAKFQHCVHTHSNPSVDGPGGAYASRKDVFGLHCKPPAGAKQGAAPPPPKIEKKAPAANPPKLKKEEGK